MVKLNKNTNVVFKIMSILVLIFLFSIIFAVININNSTILSGVSINGIDMSQMTKEEATKILSNLIEEKKNTSIKVYYIENTDKISGNEINYETNIDTATLEIEYDINSAVNEAYNLGRVGNIFQNNYSILNLLINKKDIKLDMSINEENLSKAVENISSNLPGKLVQSGYYIEGKKIIITRGEKGNILQEDKFKESLFNMLNNITQTNQDILALTKSIEPDEIDIDSIYNEIYKKPQDAYYEEDPFKVYKEVQGVDFDMEYAKKLISENPNETEYTIPLKYTKAKTTLEDLDVDIFHDLLGSFTTRYDEKNTDRTTNLNLAASKINGTILSPNEEFSYNKVVGKRSIDAGYKEAKIYVNGEVVDGLGGGICQISSTLYNAVVFANLDITERHNHQFVTSYVQPGRDATVAYGAKDLKFINNRTYPIKIKVSINSGIAKVEIYGIKEENEYNIDFDTEVISTIDFTTKYEEDSSLKKGEEKVKQKGTNGQVVKVYKVVRQNGMIVSRDLISQDTYNALNKIVLKAKSDKEDL